MWWNDIKDIKEWMERLTDRLIRIEGEITEIKRIQEDGDQCNSISADLNEMMEKIEKIEEEFPRFHSLINPNELVSTYEKHIKKIEEMMLEFKGCVSMARSSIAERKELDAELKEMKNVARISQEIYASMISFVGSANRISNQHFKIEAIYKAICEKEEVKKKSPRKKKSTAL
jgi:methyl-accepting chemotaxis protein